jgi:hypothetical protein
MALAPEPAGMAGPAVKFEVETGITLLPRTTYAVVPSGETATLMP